MTYIHLLFSHLPAFGAKLLLGLSTPEKNKIVFLISRFINLAAFIGCGALVYILARRFAGALSSALASAVLLFSLGYAVHSKFLTVDILLAFFMLAAFYFALRIYENGKTRDYLIAGLFAGIAAGVKYNGIFVIVALAVIHLMLCHNGRRGLRETFFNRNLALAFLWTPLGMFIADPAILLNFHEFLSDVYVNLSIVRFYEGETEGTSYGKILAYSLELFGPLGCAFVFISNFSALYFLLNKLLSQKARVLLAVSLVLFLSYFTVMGSSPNMTVRYVLPIYVFLVPACAFFFSLIGRKPSLLLGSVILLYGSTCLWIVGERFAADPRMQAIMWVKENAGGSVLESSHYSPDWKVIIGDSYQTVTMPNINPNKMPILQKLFDPDSFISSSIDEVTRRRSSAHFSFYTPESLRLRAPDYVTVHSHFADQFLRNEDVFPQIADYFRQLLAGKLNYRIVFDEQNPASLPWWAYPKGVGNVGGRMVILQRESN